MALDFSTLQFYSSNNISFYSPCSTVSSGSVGSWDGASSAGLSDLQAEFVDKYHEIASNLSVQYGIPWETVVAQGILESAAGTSNFAVNRNNFFGIGAFDSNPDNAFSYSTPEEGWRGYYENIRVTSTYRGHGVFQGDAITDPYVYLQAIKDAGYATSETYVESNSVLIKAIEERAKEKGWLSSAELAKKYPEMLENAAKNADGSSEAPSASSISATCPTVENSIADTAKELAWDENKGRSLKPEFEAAAKEVGTDYTVPDCGKFVATTILKSGVDPSFPKSYTLSILEYLQSSSLWTEIDNTGNVDDLMPGDVFVNHNSQSSQGHTYIYIGDGKIAQASLNVYYGYAGENVYFSDNNGAYHIFRLASSASGATQVSSGTSCGCVDKSMGLEDGGFTSIEEAEKSIISAYLEDSLVPPLSLVMPATGDYHDNCVAFSNWFVHHYTTITNGSTISGNGNQIAYNLYDSYASDFPELTASSTPSVYSVASWTSAKPNTNDGNHTGVVVGIDQSNDRILIAEAGWNNPSFTGVHEYSLSTFTGDGCYYVNVNAYMKDGLK